MISAGNGKYKVFLEELKQGDDIVVLLRGGQRPHIGSVVLCEPGKKPRVINRKGHFDWAVAKPIAQKICSKRRKPVVCIAGIHVDNATDEEIGILKKNCKKIEGMVS
jgi:gallate decarboxylase subunit D